MILKVTVLKNEVDVFSVDIDVRQPGELSTGVKAALDEFHRVSPRLRSWTAIFRLDSIRHNDRPRPRSARRHHRRRCQNYAIAPDIKPQVRKKALQDIEPERTSSKGGTALLKENFKKLRRQNYILSHPSAWPKSLRRTLRRRTKVHLQRQLIVPKRFT
jgi:hypothetical protein